MNLQKMIPTFQSRVWPNCLQLGDSSARYRRSLALAAALIQAPDGRSACRKQLSNAQLDLEYEKRLI
jgi:hypothetical protein